MNISRERMEAAKRYAAADTSDPFAFTRALTHMRNGIAGYRQERGDSHGMGEDAFYSADQTTEERETALGEKYTAIAYRNRRRP